MHRSICRSEMDGNLASTSGHATIDACSSPPARGLTRKLYSTSLQRASSQCAYSWQGRGPNQSMAVFRAANSGASAHWQKGHKKAGPVPSGRRSQTMNAVHLQQVAKSSSSGVSLVEANVLSSDKTVAGTSDYVSATAPRVVDATQLSPEERKRLWMAALKPPMYSVGFMPVLVAAAAVYFESGVAPWARCGGFVLAAILVIAWLNLSNDAFDASTGVDKTKPESIVNLTGGRWQLVLVVAFSCLTAGVSLLGYLINATGDGRVGMLLAASIVCGYIYQGPPFRLSYKGLGEPLCFFAFGPSATTAFYLALQPVSLAATATAAAAAAGPVSMHGSVGALALLVGATTTVILFCSHFHQIEGDTAAGKRSPLVRLGTDQGRKVLRAGVIGTYATAGAAAVSGALPLTAAGALALSLPAAQELVAFADANYAVAAKIAPLKKYAVKWHVLFGMSMCLGLAVGRLTL